MQPIDRLFVLLVFALLQPFAGEAMAQEFPSKPIRIITGPSPDIVARIFGKKFTEAFGQQIVAESIPAGGGKLAAEAVARARPDGYTLLNAVPSFMISAAVQGNMPDLSTDFAPVALTNLLPLVLVVSSALPVTSVQDLIALARTRPGEINYGGVNGNIGHLAFDLFKSMTKTDMVHVPYKSANDTMAAILSGQIQAIITTYGVVAGLRQSGKVRVLAVTTSQRSRLVPDLPTLAESGLPGYDLVGWNGFLAPAGTPPAVIAKLNAAVLQALKQPDVVQQLAAVGYEPAPDFTAQRFGEFLKVEVGKWNKLVRDTGIRMD